MAVEQLDRAMERDRGTHVYVAAGDRPWGARPRNEDKGDVHEQYQARNEHQWVDGEVAGEPAAPDAAEPAGAGPKKIGREDMDKVSGGGWGPQTVTTVRVG